MIVVEGFDGAGKTVLANQIASKLGWPTYHTGGPTRDMDDVRRCLRRTYMRFLESCVQDRCTHVSESVYSLFDRPLQAAQAMSCLYELRAAKVLVYCRPPTDVLLEAIASHAAKDHETSQHVDRVKLRARELISVYDAIVESVKVHVDVVQYDRTTHVFDWVMDEVRSRLERQP